MLCRVFTLRFNPALDGFDDQALRDFLDYREIVSIHDHFFEQQGVAYLSLVVCYRTTATMPNPETRVSEKPARDETWRDLLAADDWPLFNTLRDWRSDFSKAEGVPPYVICTNRQLAEIIKSKPQNLASLRMIEGFGDAKIKKYGRGILEILNGRKIKSDSDTLPRVTPEKLDIPSSEPGDANGKP